jgi:uncharacterized OB-fold protein
MSGALEFPHPDTAWPLTQLFWEGAASDRLVLPRCRSCHRLCWYPEPSCPRCDGALVWEAVTGDASLYSWVEVRHPFLAAFASSVPYVPAIVTLDEDPTIRIVTRLIDVNARTLDFDMALAVTFGQLTFDGIDGSTPAPFFTPRPS